MTSRMYFIGNIVFIQSINPPRNDIISSGRWERMKYDKEFILLYCKEISFTLRGILIQLLLGEYVYNV